MNEIYIPKVSEITQADTARAIAQDWQANFENQNYSYADLANWGAYFNELSEKFPELTEEFKENGII